MGTCRARPRYPGSLNQACLWVLLLTLVLAASVPSIGDAQVPVTTSITPTHGTGDLGTLVSLPHNHIYDITGGTRPGSGSILFHSFGDFSVGAGDVANFLNKGSFDLNGKPLGDGLDTSNILVRVTNPNPSSIFGMIQTNGDSGFGNANLFLMNPSGILFGPTASLNVGGSVSFTTAQYLRLFDGLNGVSANFYADPANANSVLAVSPVGEFGFLPAAYGFLTAPDSSATITVQGSALSVPSAPPGSSPNSISLVGGKVVIQGATLPDQTVQRAQLSAPNGRILLATSASPGEFDVTTLFVAGPNVESVPFSSYGVVSLEAGSSIDVSGEHTMWIKGGQLVLSANDATLNTSGNTANQDSILLGPGSVIWTSNSGTDSSVPDLQLTAPDVRMTGGAFIFSQTDGPGRGGNVDVTANRVTMEQGTAIFTLTTGLDAGGLDVGGNVSIQGIQGAGSAAESVTLSGGSQVANSTIGSGTGGEISITAKALDLNGGSTLSSSTSGSAANGGIVVNVQQASLSTGATFDSKTSFSGENPPIGGGITVQGLLGEGSRADSLILEGPGTGLKTEAFGGGSLGNITVDAKTVTMMDSAVIQAGSPQASATAGTITIDADSVGISDGSLVSSLTFSLDAGQVKITAHDQLSLNNGSIQTNTGSPTGGQGGDVILSVGNASLTNGATINSNSTGTGNAGNISIRSSSNFVMQNSSMTTEASQASGGRVTINAAHSGMVQLINSKIVTSVAGSDGDTSGGDISIDPQFVILQNSQVLAQAFTGTGGNINIVSNVFLADPLSLVDASSQLGVSGTVDIRAPVQNVSGELVVLSHDFASAAALLAQQCAARVADGAFSTFVVASREGLPMEPGGFLPSPSFLTELGGSALSGQPPQPPHITAVGVLPQHDARPLQLAKLGNACRQ